MPTSVLTTNKYDTDQGGQNTNISANQSNIADLATKLSKKPNRSDFVAGSNIKIDLDTPNPGNVKISGTASPTPTATDKITDDDQGKTVTLKVRTVADTASKLFEVDNVTKGDLQYTRSSEELKFAVHDLSKFLLTTLSGPKEYNVKNYLLQVDTNKTNIATNAASITANDKAIKSNKVVIISNTSDIINNKTVITRHTTQINNNATNINSNAQNIIKANTKIDNNALDIQRRPSYTQHLSSDPSKLTITYPSGGGNITFTPLWNNDPNTKIIAEADDPAHPGKKLISEAVVNADSQGNAGLSWYVTRNSDKKLITAWQSKANGDFVHTIPVSDELEFVFANPSKPAIKIKAAYVINEVLGNYTTKTKTLGITDSRISQDQNAPVKSCFVRFKDIAGDLWVEEVYKAKHVRFFFYHTSYLPGTNSSLGPDLQAQTMNMEMEFFDYELSRIPLDQNYTTISHAKCLFSDLTGATNNYCEFSVINCGVSVSTSSSQGQTYHQIQMNFYLDLGKINYKYLLWNKVKIEWDSPKATF